jgi:hypothetical protein
MPMDTNAAKASKVTKEYVRLMGIIGSKDSTAEERIAARNELSTGITKMIYESPLNAMDKPTRRNA